MKRKIVNNRIYEDLGEKWYKAEDDPIALLRAEARFRNPWVLENLKKYNCVDMEAYALAYVCKKMNVLFRCYKYITDIVGEEEQYNNWEQNINNGTELFNKKLKDYE